MRGYPWLPPVDFEDKGDTGAQLMRPLDRLVVIEDEQDTVLGLGALGICVYGWFRLLMVLFRRWNVERP